VGATVAAATSPLSPLSPGLKQAIGWAYTVYGIYSNWGSNSAGAEAEGHATDPGVESTPNGATPDGATVRPAVTNARPAEWDAKKLDPNDGHLENFMKIVKHNASKDNALGFSGANAAKFGGENSALMQGLSKGVPNLCCYGVLHDIFIDTIEYLTDVNMSTGAGLYFNVGSNVVLVGAGLKDGAFDFPGSHDDEKR
jgi:hypothetical protein